MPLGNNAKRYDAIIRISEALSACREPEELARVLADRLGEFLHFDHLDVVVFKENSKEIEVEWCAVGNSPWRFPDVPVEELPAWHVYDTQEPLHIADWNADQRFPRLKEAVQPLAAALGVKIGSLVRVPLTTPRR